jgi:Flp pilus assembly protein TadG
MLRDLGGWRYSNWFKELVWANDAAGTYQLGPGKISMLNRSSQGHKSVGGDISPTTRRISRGQAAVEFAMVSILALVVMMVGVQFALVGQAALALSQGASAIARYAAVNESTLGSSYSGAPNAAMQNLLSSSLNTNSWGDLTVTITSYKGGTASTTTTTPVATVDRAAVTLSYVTTNKIALPNPFMKIPGLFPGISFPSALSAQDQELYE